MDHHTLNPPNSAALSGNVIGSVVQRKWAARNKKKNVEEMAFCKQPPQRHKYRQTPYARPTLEPQANSPSGRDDVTPAQTTLNSVMNLMEQTSSLTCRKLQSVRSSDLETANQIVSKIKAGKHSISAELQAAVVTEALKRKIHHRERCRVNQARYRQRQLKVKNKIQDEITKIQAEIKELESQRFQDASRLRMTPTIWVRAAEYFRHFHRFLSSPISLETTAADFLREIVAPDVVGSSSFGVETQIQNWRIFAFYFSDADLELKGMHMPTPDTLVASTSTTVTITSNSLRYAFPHLNSDGNPGAQEGVWSPLAARMLGQKLVMHGSVTFGWNYSSGKVVRIQTQTDMLSPMLKLLGSLDAVSCVFESAMITPECRFVRRE